MQFTITTAKMNAILSRISKGVGNSKVLPITEYLKITLEEGVLTVVSTNSVNFITYIDREVKGTDGSVIVKADKFIKLAAKTTKTDITFTKKDDHLEVKGNGVYKVELNTTDAFPEYTFDHNVESVIIDVATMQRMFNINGASIAKDMAMPCLTGFNVGETCVTTDGVKMCLNPTQIFAGNQALVTQTLAELLGTLSGEKVTVQKEGKKMLFTTENVVIFGSELEGIEDYPDISVVLEIPYEAHVVVHKDSLLATLERLDLFVDAFNNKGIQVNFNEGILTVNDLKNNSSEDIAYMGKENFTEPVSVSVNLGFFRDLLNALTGEKATIHYGQDLPLKIEENGVLQILGLMSNE